MEAAERSVEQKKMGFREIADMAFELFEGKYSMDAILEMPYKYLLSEISNQVNLNKKKDAEEKAREKQRQLKNRNR